MISRDTTIEHLLDEHPALVEALAEFHPHFGYLRNRLLRKVMAPRVTVAQAARIAGVPTNDLLAALRRSLGETGVVTAAAGPAADETRPPIVKPEALARVPVSRQVHLDVREDIRRGAEPFARIMATVKTLGPGEALVLRAPFEPIPLYDVLGRRGFGHWTERLAGDDWSVWFSRDLADARAATGEAAAAPSGALDVRGLEPPQPLVRVLERLEALQPGEELVVIHDRRPVFLYPHVEERGFVHETEEPAPGLVRIRIRRPAATP